MNRKHLTTIAIVILVLGTAWAVYSQWQTLFPSQQMKELRQLEGSLDLPKPKYRNEEDRGLYKDSKGAFHYDRHIALSYEDAAILETLRAKLLENSWQQNEEKTSTDYKYFSFNKGSGAETKCVNGYIKPVGSDGITLYISLQAAGEYSCNPASRI